MEELLNTAFPLYIRTMENGGAMDAIPHYFVPLFVCWNITRGKVSKSHFFTLVYTKSPIRVFNYPFSIMDLILCITVPSEQPKFFLSLTEIFMLLQLEDQRICYQRMMATNYVGAFCLTKILLLLLRNSHVPARIVNVTSFTHRNVIDMQIDKEFIAGTLFSNLEPYPFAHIYEYSKICFPIFTYELHRQFSLNNETCQVSVTAADPGCVKTNIIMCFQLSISCPQAYENVAVS